LHTAVTLVDNVEDVVPSAEDVPSASLG